MKIIDLKCAVIGKNPIVRIVTDEGISGYGEVEQYKPYLKPFIMHFREALIGLDPTDVERCMLRIRQRGSFKPWGAAVSVIEHALWDIAGKAAGVPVYKLLGGKVRDKVRVYNGAIRVPFKSHNPEDYADDAKRMKALPEGFTIVKQGIAFHSGMKREIPDLYFGEPDRSPFHGALDSGLLTERGMKHIIACVEAMKEVLGDEIGLALDCGPGWTVPDAIRFARALEPLNIMWLEDLITGDYVPYVNADVYPRGDPRHLDADPHRRADLSPAELQGADREPRGEHRRPRPCRRRRHRRAEVDRRIRQPARHPDGAARHRQRRAWPCRAGAGVGDAAAQFHCLRIPDRRPGWWYDIVDGLPDPIVKNGMIEVWDRPGMGVEINPERAKRYLSEEDKAFFD